MTPSNKQELRLRALTEKQRRELATASLNALVILKRSAPRLSGGLAPFPVEDVTQLEKKEDRASPDVIVRAIRNYVDLYRESSPRLDDDCRMSESWLRFLAMLWGEQVRRAHQWAWHWATPPRRLCLVSPTQSHVVFPESTLARIIGSTDESNTLALLFNMIPDLSGTEGRHEVIS